MNLTVDGISCGKRALLAGGERKCRAVIFSRKLADGVYITVRAFPNVGEKKSHKIPSLTKQRAVRIVCAKINQGPVAPLFWAHPLPISWMTTRGNEEIPVQTGGVGFCCLSINRRDSGSRPVPQPALE